ncbi:MAG: hypothetical protein JWN56_1067 [Sphingobacteriales bacterium]|nr:hypothetical protein [Sphingobacteriales bacterium]
MKNLYENPLHSGDFDVLKSNTYLKGVYKTFMDFRNNKLETTANFYVEYKGTDSELNRKATVKWVNDDPSLERFGAYLTVKIFM